MEDDLFTSPTEATPAFTVEDIREMLVAAGLPCAIEPHDGKLWIVFEGRDSNLVFTVDADGHPESAVMPPTIDDDPGFAYIIFDVFECLGWNYIQDEVD
jgi:hypothetical protein